MEPINLVAPTAEPIDIFDAKLHARIDTDADNATVLSKIAAAREYAETFLNRRLMTATWQWNLDQFPCNGEAIYVPFGKLQSVTWIKYYDTSGTQQTWSSSLYIVDTNSDPGRITPAYGEIYPIPRAIPNTIEIKYVAGYSSASAVPESIKEAIRILVAGMYETRESMTDQGLKMVPFSVQSLLSQYRLPEFA